MNYWLILTALTAGFLLAILLAPWILPWLRRLKCSQSILEIGPSWHKETKQGTPTIGGLIFIIPTVLVSLVLGFGEMLRGDLRLMLVLGFTVLCGLVGFLDDYIKVVKKRNQGLTVWQKTLPLMICIALFLGTLYVNGIIDDTIFAAALTGGLAAFLIYNFHPAKVFMGDTGSLFLGAAIVGLAMAYDMPYFILIGGIMFLIEGTSVVLQVGFYKLTHGKRIFKMTPIHHHFEMCKWSEVKIVAVFTAVSALGCLLALWGMFYFRYFNV